MNKKRRITTLIVAMAMFCMMSMSVLADFDVIVPLAKDQVWSESYTLSRLSTDYSYVFASCDSVYPTDYSSDNFTKIQARLVNSLDTLIMTKKYEVLKESDPASILYIKEGYLSLKTVYIQFRGNSNNAAKAVVDFW